MMLTMKAATPPLRKAPVKINSIHCTLRFFLVLLLFTGLLPVQGIFSSPQDLQFKWLSWPLFYSLYVFVSACVMFTFQFYHYLMCEKGDITLEDIIHITTAALSFLFFVQLARQWPELIRKWCDLDEKFNSIYRYPRFLKLKLCLVTAVYTVLIFGEYFFFVFVTYRERGEIANITFQLVVETIYFYIFEYISYHTFMVLILALPSFSTFMAFSLIDVFLILLSISVSSRFQQINEKLEQHKKKKNSINFWMTLRRNYSEMGNLCSDINDKLSNIIVLSYGSNMMLLLIQLRTFISNEVGKEAILFCTYSFLFLIIRLWGVYYFSSRINAESRRPVRILFAVSTETYNIEIRRWYMQMKLDSIALTGKTLFKITPGLILSIAGAIVTYELIFIQFSQSNK